MNPAVKVPVIVLSGFLGSGKTTLLRKLLEEAAMRRLKPGVLMNELGRRDIDGELISRSSAAAFPLEKLLDGCICCTKKAEIHGAIVNLLRQRPDLLLLELTGVANPEEIAEGLAEPELISRVYLHRVITLVDAEHALEYNSIFASDKQLVRTLRSQLTAADELIINKTDLVPPAHSGKVTEMVRKYNPGGRIYYAVKADIPLSPFFAAVSPAERNAPVSTLTASGPARGNRSHFHVIEPRHRQAAPPSSGASSTSFSRINTVSLPIAAPLRLPPGKVERFIKKWGSGLLRAKGYVRFSRPDQTCLVQFAGKRFNWEPISYSGPYYLVLIGYGLDEQAIAEEWSSLV